MASGVSVLWSPAPKTFCLQSLTRTPAALLGQVQRAPITCDPNANFVYVMDRKWQEVQSFT